MAADGRLLLAAAAGRPELLLLTERPSNHVLVRASGHWCFPMRRGCCRLLIYVEAQSVHS